MRTVPGGANTVAGIPSRSSRSIERPSRTASSRQTPSAIATAALLAVTGAYELRYLADYYLPYALLLSWGEAFITGMTMALMIAYYPKWVMLFDDKRYLARR